MNVQTVREKVTMEHGLLVMFLGVAVYMFIESYTFSERAAAFPRFTAGATIVGTLVLLFRSYLPGPLQRLVVDSKGAFEDVTDEEVAPSAPEPGETEAKQESPEPATTDDEDVETRYVDLKWISMHGSQFTAIISVLFVVVSYLIGMLWAAPLFVATYLGVLRRPWHIVLVLSSIAFLLAYSFVLVLGIGIDGGVLLDLGRFL